MPAPRTAGEPGSTGTYAAPERRTPWIAATASRPLGRNSPTRSPRPTPHRWSRVASRSADRRSSAIGISQAAFILDGRVIGPSVGRVVEELAEVVSIHAHESYFFGVLG